MFETLRDLPDTVFSLLGQDTNPFSELAKRYLDPLAPKFSVLDEIYVDGLDASQVFGQLKMVVEGAGLQLLGNVAELRDRYHLDNADDDSEEEDDEEDEEEDDEETALGDQVADEADASSEEDDFEGFVSAEEDLPDGLEPEEDEQAGELEDEEQDLEEEEEVGELEDDDQEVENDAEDKPETQREVKEITEDKFGLNDGFFDIDEYNKQVLALEHNDGALDDDNDDEEIDMFGDIDDGSDDGMDYYDDFFDAKGKVSTVKLTAKATSKSDDVEDYEDLDEDDYDAAVEGARLDLFADDDEEENDQKAGNDDDEPEEKLSSFEKKQRELQREIEKLEAELVADKKWTMKGEVSARDRPMDSLVSDRDTQELEFERTAKPVPVITEEVTELLEDIIRRRIANSEFDDLPKRFISDVALFHKKQKFDLSGEKLTKSLAEIYEDNYTKPQGEEEISEQVKQQHDEILDLFTLVCHKLDTLCLAHFVPKPHQFKQIEIAVLDNAAAINTEDSQPLHVSLAATLAPQEVYKVGDDKVKANGALGRLEVQLKSGLTYSKEELTREEKQRLRRAAKRKRAKQFNERQLVQQQQQKQAVAEGRAPKRAKKSDVIDTLAKGNVTVIGDKGELRDVKGNLKKDGGLARASHLKM